MKQTFCEYMMWHGFPVIRKKIAEVMMDEFGLSQKEAAEKLGISSAAVCQYKSKKRAKIDVVDYDFLNEIRKSAKNIINNGNDHVLTETCRLCKIIRSNGTSCLFPDDENFTKICYCDPE
ncbi:MAG: hypothetical protein QHH19_06515 [Candidatus Thermoplasmatota archaeon]|jgi:predicted transcriptional regulator|nr:hypothetical protein [Candidatus Thermoplasmatota archaeon]